jgi:AhpD family alkylhydroperoxidase
MDPFKRRTYHSVAAWAADLRALLSRRREIRALMHSQEIDAAFRERLMLVVTEVNGCRYCSYGHARLALAEGISPAEIEALGQGAFAGSPPDQVPALLYAQHWAESDGRPDPAARAQVVARYGEQATHQIELALRMIRMGNLMGNTWDYVLYRVSFGRWGVPKPSRASHTTP